MLRVIRRRRMRRPITRSSWFFSRALVFAMVSSEALRQADEESASLAILRREHADAAAAADLVIDVKHIDHIAADGHARDAQIREVMADAQIDGAVRRHMP